MISAQKYSCFSAKMALFNPKVHYKSTIKTTNWSVLYMDSILMLAYIFLFIQFLELYAQTSMPPEPAPTTPIIISTAKIVNPITPPAVIKAIEHCRANNESLSRIQTFEGLIGYGWDNLRNIPMGAVWSSEFKNCRTTSDGLYLISDDMLVLPMHRIKLDSSAEFYGSYQRYIKSNSEGVNANAGINLKFFGISGSYDDEEKEIKDKFYVQKTCFFR